MYHNEINDSESKPRKTTGYRSLMTINQSNLLMRLKWKIKRNCQQRQLKGFIPKY